VQANSQTSKYVLRKSILLCRPLAYEPAIRSHEWISNARFITNNQVSKCREVKHEQSNLTAKHFTTGNRTCVK